MVDVAQQFLFTTFTVLISLYPFRLIQNIDIEAFIIHVIFEEELNDSLLS